MGFLLKLGEVDGAGAVGWVKAGERKSARRTSLRSANLVVLGSWAQMHMLEATGVVVADRGAVVEEEDEDEDGGSGGAKSGSATGLSDYDYLLGMAIWSLTKEKVRSLVDRRGLHGS